MKEQEPSRLLSSLGIKAKVKFQYLGLFCFKDTK